MRISSILLALVVALSTYPANAHETVWITGLGANSCASFVEVSNRKPEVQLAFYSWAQGYMSGVNEMRVLVGADVARVAPTVFDGEAQIVWLLEYCEAHPERSYLHAVFELFLELLRLQEIDSFIPGRLVPSG